MSRAVEQGKRQQRPRVRPRIGSPAWAMAQVTFDSAIARGMFNLLFVMRLHDLVPTIQVAIGPVILISGVGLLLLSMTNRLGRVIDRSRQLCEVVHRSAAADRVRLLAQLRILSRRARLIRSSIALATASVFLASVLIIGLFVSALFQWEVAGIIAVLFIACLSALIGSLAVFFQDINLALRAFELEIRAAASE
jgi:hypothetical protein